MITVLSVDPGKTTGVSVVAWSENQEELPILLKSYELQPEEFADMTLQLISYWKPLGVFYVVCERFTITAQTVRNSQAPYSLEQIGVLKYLCRRSGYSDKDISFQAPVDAKGIFPNPALKKVGTWHEGGDGHANDSIRHALLKLTKLGWKPKVLLD